MTLTTASTQLFTRPADETFSGWNDILTALRQREENTSEIGYSHLKASAADQRVYLNLNNTQTTTMSNWSFRQLCGQVGASARTINALTAETAATALNELMARAGNQNGVANVLDNSTVRGLYSRHYRRISDLNVFRFFHTLSEQYGYEPAGNFAGKRGGMAPIRPEASGLYSGCEDSFGIIANEEGKIEIDGTELYHAVMFGNSEVGKKSLWVTDCLYNFICGNHQIWGAQRVRTIAHRHIGTSVTEVLEKARKQFFEKTDAERREWREGVAATYQAAVKTPFADSTEKATKRLQSYIPKSHAVGALKMADHPAAYPKSPLSHWGIGQAVTLYSQTLATQDTRHSLDVAAGKIIQSASH